MAQSDLVAALRAWRRARERADEARVKLDETIREAVVNEEWAVMDIAELTGWSRETIRKIVNPPETEKRNVNKPRGARRPRRPRADS